MTSETADRSSGPVEVLHNTGRQLPIDPAREAAIVPLGDLLRVLHEVRTRHDVGILAMGESEGSHLDRTQGAS